MQTSITIKTFLLLLLFSTSPAWAEWVKVAETDRAIFYIDPATIRKEGNLRKAWEVHDFKTRQADGNMSDRLKNEYDCKNERNRLLAGSKHPESMGGGRTIFNQSEESTNWNHIPPGTAAATILKIVCAQ